jgi:hypothetical protein
MAHHTITTTMSLLLHSRPYDGGQSCFNPRGGQGCNWRQPLAVDSKPPTKSLTQDRVLPTNAANVKCAVYIILRSSCHSRPRESDWPSSLNQKTCDRRLPQGVLDFFIMDLYTIEFSIFLII